MYDNTRKRKRHSDYVNKRNHRQHDQEDNLFHRSHQREPEHNPVLFIQAHEADLRRGPQALELAKSLEAVEYINIPTQGASCQVHRKIGSALIQWTGGNGPRNDPFSEDEEETISLGAQKTAKGGLAVRDESGVWVDRYDARLLLDALPDFDSPFRYTSAHTAPSSPSGWSDLPSDTEETFFFSPEEAKDFRNEKRRRLLEQAHEERVKARLKEEKEENQEAVDEDPWGGSDEEPDDTQKELMTRTAVHLLSSPNPAQLEMRILANHGADKRFAFLKGRWNRSWRLIKAKLRVEMEEKERKAKQEQEQKGLGMLAGYDSESEDEDHGKGEGQEDHLSSQKEDHLSSQKEDHLSSQKEDHLSSQKEEEVHGRDDEARKEMRRQKAKEWAERRRLSMNVAESEDREIHN